MSGKMVCLSGLAVALLGVGVVRGQGPGYPPGGPGVPPPAGGAAGPAGGPFTGQYTTHDGNGSGGPWAGPGAAPAAPGNGSGRVSDWITYPRAPGCCGPVGGNGPIGSEIYVRSGLSFPINGAVFGNVLQTGWAIEGGGRALFFNPAVDAAWTVDLGVSNFNYNAHKPEPRFPLFDVPSRSTNAVGQTVNNPVPRLDVSVASLNQTFANVAIGREWYLLGRADCHDGNGGLLWRVGFDAGGRWGSAKVDLNEIRHLTHAVGGIFVAVHSDVEVPCGCCIFQAGIRGEYDDTWSDVLQRQNDANLQTLNVMITLGVRF
jgi:hypothetical protein